MRRDTARTLALGALIAVLTAAAFAPVRGNGFVSVDDDAYVTANPWVLQGLTSAGAAWALRATHAANWHPLTWLSHMADVSLFGTNAGAHHLTSLGLHLAAALLLLLLLRRLTGRLAESALVAALFALHPLRVESVAWVAERKDVLSGLLMLLTTLAYARYAARPGVARYLPVAGLFALALLAKPMAVSLPLLLLLLDGWPLGRFRNAPPWRLVAEKLPLLALSAAASAMTLAAQRGEWATSLAGAAPLGHRLGNAALSYAGYVAKTFWPADLAVFYPYPVGPLPAWKVAGAAALLAAALAGALALARSRPWLAAGWLWFLVALAPVIGIVQAGSQAMADRYTYVPQIGLFVALVWSVAPAVRRLRAAPVAVVATAALLVALAFATQRQTLLWRDSATLLAHAVAAVPDNWPARYSLGTLLETYGRLAEAEEQYRESLRVNPAYVPANNNLARLFALRGRFDLAIPLMRAALAGRPDSAMQHLNLGLVLEAAGQPREAAGHYAEAARLDPGNPAAREKAAELGARLRSSDPN